MAAAFCSKSELIEFEPSHFTSLLLPSVFDHRCWSGAWLLPSFNRVIDHRCCLTAFVQSLPGSLELIWLDSVYVIFESIVICGNEEEEGTGRSLGRRSPLSSSGPASNHLDSVMDDSSKSQHTYPVSSYPPPPPPSPQGGGGATTSSSKRKKPSTDHEELQDDADSTNTPMKCHQTNSSTARDHEDVAAMNTATGRSPRKEQVINLLNDILDFYNETSKQTIQVSFIESEVRKNAL
ncbi:hypothetical protein L6452_13663 [Arctium lappa]|uniref:Uncharacterized protein n=1 Tax=Arctium lappa TaxID=4217 RepID=A0ACB9CIT8_ARCLA|nr:hypothetical protein L6452_13663 [Arctium lappa]